MRDSVCVIINLINVFIRIPKNLKVRVKCFGFGHHAKLKIYSQIRQWLNYRLCVHVCSFFAPIVQRSDCIPSTQQLHFYAKCNITFRNLFIFKCSPDLVTFICSKLRTTLMRIYHLPPLHRLSFMNC